MLAIRSVTSTCLHCMRQLGHYKYRPILGSLPPHRITTEIKLKMTVIHPTIHSKIP